MVQTERTNFLGAVRRVVGACAVRIRRSTLFTAHAANISAVIHVPGYTFIPIGAADLRDPVFTARGRRERFVARFADGHRCFVFVDSRDAIAAYFWLTVAGATPVAVPWELGAEALLPSHTAYVWDCFTVTEHRRRGLYRAGILQLTAIGVTEGAATLAIVARTRNVASIRGITATGFTATAAYATIGIGPFVLIHRLGSWRCIRPRRGVFVLGETL